MKFRIFLIYFRAVCRTLAAIPDALEPTVEVWDLAKKQADEIRKKHKEEYPHMYEQETEQTQGGFTVHKDDAA